MARFSVFDNTTGAIKALLDVPDSAILDQHDPMTEGVWVDSIVDPKTQYILIEPDTPTPGSTQYSVISRPTSSAAYSGAATLDNDGVDTGTITPIASAAVVTVLGENAQGNQFVLQTYDPWGADDTFEFTSTIAGDYLVQIVNFPDQDIEFRIPVRAP